MSFIIQLADDRVGYHFSRGVESHPFRDGGRGITGSRQSKRGQVRRKQAKRGNLSSKPFVLPWGDVIEKRSKFRSFNWTRSRGGWGRLFLLRNAINFHTVPPLARLYPFPVRIIERTNDFIKLNCPFLDTFLLCFRETEKDYEVSDLRRVLLLRRFVKF